MPARLFLYCPAKSQSQPKLRAFIDFRTAGVQTFAYEPMKSDLVRSRFDQMARFYEGVE